MTNNDKKFQIYVDTIRRDVNDKLHFFDGNNLSRYFHINNELVLASINKNFQVTDKFAEIYFGLDDPLFNNLDVDNLMDIPLPSFTCYFEGIVSIIFGQLISVAAANKLRSQFIELFGTKKKNYNIYPTPKDILDKRNLLSELKTTEFKKQTIYKLAEFFYHNNNQNDSQNNSLNLCNELIKIKGVGNWSISWFKLKALRDFNAIPHTDLAVRKATSIYFKSDKILSPEETLEKYKNNFDDNYGGYLHRILINPHLKV